MFLIKVIERGIQEVTTKGRRIVEEQECEKNGTVTKFIYWNVQDKYHGTVAHRDPLLKRSCAVAINLSAIISLRPHVTGHSSMKIIFEYANQRHEII